jgi:predicted aconitase with swiveling domain
VVVKAEPVIGGVATGRVLRCTRPLGFWGGVDPATGVVVDPENEQRGVALAGRVLMLAATRGSSSSSSVLLELILAGRAPAAIVLGEIDAILGIGIVVARELGRAGPPLLRLDPLAQSAFADGQFVAIAADGTITPIADSAVGTSDEATLRGRLAELREAHRRLDGEIAALDAAPALDQLQLQRLKKRKLALKDQIARLEAALVPDIIA